MKIINCLIVDDEPMNLFLMRENLSGLVNNIFEAKNGVEAIKVLHKEKVDCVFTDINMPILNGIELTKYIRNTSQAKLNQIPIVAVSAFYHGDILDDIYEVGFTHWIQKPYDHKDILMIIKLVEEKQMQSVNR